MKSPAETILKEAQPWFDSVKASGRTAHTRYCHRRAIRLASQFWSEHGGPKSLHCIKQMDMEQWASQLVKQGFAPITRDSYLRAWLLLFRWLEARGRVFVNPLRNFVLPKFTRRMLPVVSEQDMAKLLNSVDGRSPAAIRDRALLEVAYATGARCGELYRLNADDVGLDERIILVRGKGGRERYLPLTSSAVFALEDYLRSARLFFTRFGPERDALWLSHNGRLSARTMHRIWRRRSSTVGLKIGPHDTRRAFATHLLRRGLGPNELRLLLGHAGFHHIKHYVRYAAVDIHNMHRRSRLSR